MTIFIFEVWIPSILNLNFRIIVRGELEVCKLTMLSWEMLNMIWLIPNFQEVPKISSLLIMIFTSLIIIFRKYKFNSTRFIF